MGRKKPLLSDMLARFRSWIQAAAALLANIHLPNLTKGTIYRGAGKSVCVPGLNCYSCPGSTGACPIGAFQAVVGASKFRFSYYITGILILFGVLLGRVICGFLCPFGWFQDLLHKLPTKKLSTRRLKPLRFLKYAVLLVLVWLLPILATNESGMGNPYFCKYLCPQGVLEGAIPLSLASSSVRTALGTLFVWKAVVLGLVVLLSIVFYRPFCKWLCPLGAFYALFNKVSLLQLRVDRHRCVSCGRCAAACKMDVDMPHHPNHTECIRCGTCMKACPTHAIRFTYGFGSGEDSRRTKHIKRIKTGGIQMKTTKILSAALAILMALVLIACKSAARNTSENNPTPVPDTVQTQISEHLDQINTILNGHADLWDKLFAQSDDTANQVFEDRSVSKYLELLLEKHKELITDDERNALAGDIEKICGIEDALEKLYAALPEESDNRQNSDAEKSTEAVLFPIFEGKDLDGNAVSSKTLFAANKVTVVNFWFSGCSPCVEELDELNALNEKLKEKGGAVIGINTDTLNGDESQIAEAKKLLAQKGAAYPNIWFDKDSEAGQFSNNLLGFPTTYVVDSNGQIVGQPILGSVDELGVTELLWAQIYSALEEDPIFY